MESRVFDFEEFHLDCEGLELSRNGRGLKVERKPLELLILLVRRHGDLVTRAEIAEQLWEPAVFVDTEHGINTAVRKIRQTLRDDSAQPRFVQTIPGKGYRFIATAVDVSPVPVISHAAPKAEVGMSKHGVTLATRPVAWFVAVAGAIALAIVFFIVRPMTGQPRITSIAVLPLDNLSPQPGQDYLAAGMTDELITMLAKNSSLRITSRTSVLQYKGAKRPLPQVAQELGVDGILEGSISRAGNHVHMTVQLIRARTDAHIWAESYDRDASDLFSLPQDAARAVAKRLNSAAPIAHSRFVRPEAHDAYIHGRYLWFTDVNDKAGDYFKKATELQPDYASAWAGLSIYYMVAAIEGLQSPKDTFAPGEAAAIKAVELDESLPEAHLSLSAATFVTRWDWPRAEQECARAIALDPRFAEAYHFRARMLAALKRHHEAIEAQKKATELDPFTRPWALTLSFYEARQYDAAFDDARQRVESYPHDSILDYLLSGIYSYEGLRKQAQDSLEKALTESGDTERAQAVRLAFAQGGYRAVSQFTISALITKAKTQYVSPVDLARLYAQLGRRNEALACLENAYRERAPGLLWIRDDPAFDFLDSEERYRSIIKGMGLPSA